MPFNKLIKNLFAIFLLVGLARFESITLRIVNHTLHMFAYLCYPISSCSRRSQKSFEAPGFLIEEDFRMSWVPNITTPYGRSVTLY